MCRLAAMISPLGGFWKFSRNPKFNIQQGEVMHIQVTHHTVNQNYNTNVVKIP